MAKKAKKKDTKQTKQDDGVLYFILKWRKYNDASRGTAWEREYGLEEEYPACYGCQDPDSVIIRKFKMKGFGTQITPVSHSKVILRRCDDYDADDDAIIPMSEAPGHIRFIEEGLEVL